MEENISYKLVRSRRRSICIIISENGEVIVRAPLKTSLSLIEDFLKLKADWVKKHITKINKVAIIPHEFTEGEEFLFMGDKVKLTFSGTNSKLIQLTEEAILFPQKHSKNVKKLLEKWYRKAALNVMTERTIYYSEKSGLKFNEIKVKNTKRQWGSCTSKGNLSYNWHLIMAPLQIIDYIIVHELSHMAERNHSPKFWKVVESILPDYKIRRKWLKSNKNLLIF